MLAVGVLCSGGGTNLQALIDGAGNAYRIILVVASKPNAYALIRAQNHGIPNVCLKKQDYPEPGRYEAALVSVFKSCGADLIITAGFNIILDKSFVDAFTGQIMNVHPALIPSFCGKGFYGLKVHEAVIAAGVKVSGATVHFVTEEADAGPIILQKAVSVLDDDTPETLQRRVMEEAEWLLLKKAVTLFAEGCLQIDGNKVRVKNCL